MNATPDPVPPVEDGGLDQLELEIRQLAGVGFVAIARLDDRLLVEAAVARGADLASVRSEIHRLATCLADVPVVVELLDQGDEAGEGGRVRLAVSVPVPGQLGVELHLAHHDRRAAVTSDGGDGPAVARAVISGLGVLGLLVPWGVRAVQDLPSEVGGGALVVLEHVRTGEVRRGVAEGRSRPDAYARAVLSALNRFLEAS